MQLINAIRYVSPMRRPNVLVTLACLLTVGALAKAAPPETHAQIGSVSWDTIPANVRHKSAGMAPFHQAAWTGGFRVKIPGRLPASGGIS